MELHPIISAMRRNKTGALLIAIQMGVTYAILCNALFLIRQRTALSQRPTGTDEENILVIDNLWASAHSDLPSRSQTDVVLLRSLPGVVDAFVSASYPLSNDGFSQPYYLQPTQQHATATSAFYFGDEHAIHTLGLTLVAGRNFSPDEVADLRDDEVARPKVVIVTRAFAGKMFPGGALGKFIYGEVDKSFAQVIGIVDRLQSPFTSASGDASTYVDNSILEPFRFLSAESYYIVRAQPGRLEATLQAAQKRLVDADPSRILKRVRPLAAVRAEAYRDDRSLAIILGVVSIALITVTVFGIVGLTSYWVSQRQRQIGIRRALGATRGAIVRHFQAESLLIAAVGVSAGVALAMALNIWMVSSFETMRLPVIYLWIGATISILADQLAVLWPALRAASISPASAARSA